MFQNIIYLLLSVIFVVLAWWFYFTSTRFYKLCKKIPGPTPLPVIGNIEVFRGGKNVFQNVMEIFKKSPPICRLIFGNSCIVGLTDANDIYEVLNSSKAISKFMFYTPLRLVLGVNLLTAQREDWRRHRRILNPAFNTKAIRNYIDIFNVKARILVKILKNKNDNEKFDMYEFLVMTALDMIILSATGQDFKILENNNMEIVSSMHKGKRLIKECAMSPVHWFDIVYKNSDFYKKASKIFELTRAILEPVTKEFIKSLETKLSETFNIYQEKSLRIFDYIVQSLNRNMESYTETDIVNLLRLLGVAGSDTTAFTVSVCLMLLGLHKDIQDKVVEELYDIFGNDTNSTGKYEDLQRMVYTEQVVKETMRLYPVVYATGRRIDEDIQIKEYVLPAGTDVIFSPYLLHRDPKYFPNPLKFDPERFTPDNIRARNPHCFIPFLTGPRNCIGHYYAMLQMKTVLSHLLRHFEFLPCGSREEMEDVGVLMMLRLKHGHNVRIKLRV